ncbi:MAG: hypothetical protein ACK5UY_06655 [Holosporales bacterium]
MQAALEGVQECITKHASKEVGALPSNTVHHESPGNSIGDQFQKIVEYFNPSASSGIKIASSNVASDMNVYLPREEGVFAAAGQRLQHVVQTAQENVGAALHQGFGLGEVAGGTLKALGVVGLVMSVAQLRENLTTLKDGEENVSLKTIGRRFAEDGLYNVAMAGRIMGMTFSTFGHGFNPLFGIAAYAAMQSTEKGLEKATAAYGKASQSLAITKLRLADGTSENTVRDRTVAAVQQGLVYATSANKQTSQFLNTARAAAIAVIKNPQQAMQDMGTRFNTLKTQIKIPTMPWKRDNKMQQFSETTRAVQETENRVHGNNLMAFLHFRWGKQAST